MPLPDVDPLLRPFCSVIIGACIVIAFRRICGNKMVKDFSA